MVLIAICSLVAIAIVLERIFALRERSILPGALARELESATRSGDITTLRRMLPGEASVLGNLTRIAIEHPSHSRAEASETVQSHAREEVVKLQSGLTVLEVVITIAPLLGLLGTVSGLVSVFSTLGDAATPETDPAAIAKGIAEALNTTIAGLAVAVPAVIAHSYFHKRIERMAARLEVLLNGILPYGIAPPDPASGTEAAEVFAVSKS
jgi:biopolymer transport protein ExbB